MIAESIDRQIDRSGSCWIWTGYATKEGYGFATVRRKQWLVHRYVYTQAVGSIPDGLTIDHLCRNRLCCNPEHLEAVTLQENIRRGTQGQFQKNKTHCKSGHSFAKSGKTTKNGRRLCMECRRRWSREQRMKGPRNG